MTNTEIANLSMLKLGASLISSLGDAEIPGSHYAGLLFGPTRDDCLREFQWPFAEVSAFLALKATGEHEFFEYTYQMPSDCVRIIHLLGESRWMNIEEFARQGQEVHSDKKNLKITYISNAVEPGDWDPDFREAFNVLLASRLAVPLLQAPRLKQALTEEYEAVALPKAMAAAAREVASRENSGPMKAIRRSPLNQVRWSGYADDQSRNQGFGDLPMP